MKKANAVAAGFLGLGFLWVAYVFLFVEPDMGFTSPADLYDAAKVAAGYTSLVWLVSNFVYLVFPFAVMTIAYSADDRLLHWSGLGFAFFFLGVASIDRIGIELQALLSTNEAVIAAVATFLPIRFAMLKSAVLALGVFAWRTTRLGAGEGVGPRAWRGFGWVVLVLGVGFMFALIPAPVVFAIWGIALAVQYSAAPASGPAVGTIGA